MACTKIVAIHHTLNKSLDYIEDPNKTALNNAMNYVMNSNKTEQGYFISSFNCGDKTAYTQMKQTQAIWRKASAKVLGYHVMQSFKPGEVTPEMAHHIGCEFVQKCLANKYEVVVTTHLNKNHLHNHIIFNSVSFVDGKMYRNNFTDYYRDIRTLSDDLCRQYRLSVISDPKSRGKHYTEWKAENEGQRTWRSSILEDVDQAVMVSMSFQAFIRSMKEKGYEVVTGGKYMKVRPQGKERFVRLRSLGDGYTEEAIKQRILRQRMPERPPKPTPLTVKRIKVRGDFRLSRVTWKGLRALYFYYLYKLREAQRQPLGQASSLLREDLRLMNAISGQTKFLHRHRIDTEEQLEAYKADAVRKIERLTNERRKLRNDKRRKGVMVERVAEIDAQVGALSERLKELRGDVRMCDAVMERVAVTREKKEQLLQQKHANRDRGVIVGRQDVQEIRIL